MNRLATEIFSDGGRLVRKILSCEVRLWFWSKQQQKATSGLSNQCQQQYITKSYRNVNINTPLFQGRKAWWENTYMYFTITTIFPQYKVSVRDGWRASINW